MEINEGNVRIHQRPEVTIGDKSLDELCSTAIGRLKIERELLSLCKKVREQREMILRLNRDIAGVDDARD